MKYVVLFEDNPETDLCTRLSYLPLHLAYLEKNAEQITAVGGLSDADDIGRGDLWVLSAENEDEVVRFVREDPFWPTGLRKSFQIMRWRQVFANGLRIVQTEAEFA
ncbi:MAG: YciI family protein [Cognatishimia sp.]